MNAPANIRQLATQSLEQRLRDACLAHHTAEIGGHAVRDWQSAFTKADTLKEYLSSQGIDLRTLRSVLS